LVTVRSIFDTKNLVVTWPTSDARLTCSARRTTPGNLQPSQRGLIASPHRGPDQPATPNAPGGRMLPICPNRLRLYQKFTPMSCWVSVLGFENTNREEAWRGLNGDRACLELGRCYWLGVLGQFCSDSRRRGWARYSRYYIGVICSLRMAPSLLPITGPRGACRAIGQR